MGKIRDWCLATGLEETKYRAQDFKVSGGALKGKLICLPSPYEKKVDGQLEAPILKSLIQGLSYHNVTFWRMENSGKLIHTPEGMRMVASGMTGLSDLIGCIKGQFFSLECKVSGAKLTTAQHGSLLRVKEAGGIAAVVVDVPKALAWLLEGERATCKLESGIEVL
jgi:hypothetical protein